MRKVSLKEFLRENLPEIKEKVIRRTKLIWSRRTYEDVYEHLKERTSKYPFEEQKKVIGQVVDGLKKNRVVFVSGEMGVGKTLIALYASYVYLRRGRVLVLVPEHLKERPWKEHVEEIFGDEAKVRIVETPAEFLKIREEPKRPEGLEFVVVGELSWKGMAKKEKKKFLTKDRLFNCPYCFSFRREGRLVQIEGTSEPPEFPPDSGTFKRDGWIDLAKLPECPVCRTSFMEFDVKRTKRRSWFPIADLYRDYLRSYFQLVIVDEGSMYRNKSKRGLTLGKIKAPTIVLSGTFMTGYANSLFYINMQLLGGFWRKKGFKFTSETLFLKTYGFIKRTGSKVQPAPGVKPELVAIMRRYTTFITLEDITSSLPPLREIEVPVPMTPEMEEEYLRLKEHAASQELSGLASLVVSGLVAPDLMHSEQTYFSENPITLGKVVEGLSPKEEKLIEIVRKEAEEGRKVVIFTLFTKKRDVSGRIKSVLEEAGLRAEILPDVPPEKREEWLKAAAKKLDAVILHPVRVYYGTNLQDYQTIVWYQPTYDPDLFRQASRRSFRIGQTEEVRIYQLFYEDTIQRRAFELVNEKDAVSALFNGIVNYKLEFALRTKNSVLALLAKELTGGVEP